MEDQTVDDARWLTANTVAFYGAMNLIDEFEAQEQLVADFQDNQEVSDDSEDDIGRLHRLFWSVAGSNQLNMRRSGRRC